MPGIKSNKFFKQVIMKTALQQIEEVITNYSAFKYAELMLSKEKETFTLTVLNSSTGEINEEKPSYLEYMRQTWHSKDTASLEECIENSRISKLNHYAKAIKLYTGWVENGKQFVLNKEEGFVSFVFGVPKSEVKAFQLIVNYNPNNIDISEQGIYSGYFERGISEGKYVVSTDEEELNRMCNLIGKP